MQNKKSYFRIGNLSMFKSINMRRKKRMLSRKIMLEEKKKSENKGV